MHLAFRMSVAAVAAGTLVCFGCLQAAADVTVAPTSVTPVPTSAAPTSAAPTSAAPAPTSVKPSSAAPTTITPTATPSTTIAPPPKTSAPATPVPSTTVTGIANGDFEKGRQAWAGDTGLIVKYGYGRGGSAWSAWLGGHDQGPATRSISQQVKLGSGAATLSFWTYIYTAEQGKQPFDTFAVQVLDEKGAVLGTPLALSNVDASRGYVQRTVDLKPYLGRTVQLRFQSQEDQRLATYFLIDDVVVTMR